MTTYNQKPELEFLIKEEKKKYQTEDDLQNTNSVKRFGGYHGTRYGMFPRLYRQHYWIFRSQIGTKERELLLWLWSWCGDAGIFPSLTTMEYQLGIDATNISRVLNELSNKKIVCPICGSSYSLLSIDKKQIGRYFEKNTYNLKEIEKFLQHVHEEHFGGDEPNFNENLGDYERKVILDKRKAFQEDYNKARKLTKRINKPFPKKKEEPEF